MRRRRSLREARRDGAVRISQTASVRQTAVDHEQTDEAVACTCPSRVLDQAHRRPAGRSRRARRRRRRCRPPRRRRAGTRRDELEDGAVARAEEASPSVRQAIVIGTIRGVGRERGEHGRVDRDPGEGEGRAPGRRRSGRRASRRRGGRTSRRSMNPAARGAGLEVRVAEPVLEQLRQQERHRDETAEGDEVEEGEPVEPPAGPQYLAVVRRRAAAGRVPGARARRRRRRRRAGCRR